MAGKYTLSKTWRRGSLTLEAALSVTLLLLAGFTCILFSNFLYRGEVLDQALFETADAAAFSITMLDGPVGQMAMEARLKQCLKKNLSQKGMAYAGVELRLKKLGDGAFLITVTNHQPTPLLGTLTVQKNYHVLNAGFSITHSDEQVWVTEKGERYHEAGCHTLRASKTVHTLTLSEAAEKGYGPCKICIGNTLFGKPRDP